MKAPEPPRPVASPARRALTWGLWIATPLLALALAGAALWQWSAREGSLSGALRAAHILLPQLGLEAMDVQGSLRRGGQIGSLKLEPVAGLKLQAEALTLQWQLGRLWQRELRIDRLHIARLSIDDQRPPSPPEAPDSLSLPFHASALLQIDELLFGAGTPLRLSALNAGYRFDGQQHRLQLTQLQMAQARYSGELSVMARAPMQLQARLIGALTAAVEGLDPSVDLALRADLNGALAGPAALLQGKLQIQSAAAPAAGTPAAALPRLDADFSLTPWQQVPWRSADARWQHLDLAWLWPMAPRTDSAGQARLTPDGEGVLLEAQASNALPGPWDQGRLALQSMALKARLQGRDLSIDSLRARLAGGELQAQGRWQAAADPSRGGHWVGDVLLKGIDPAALHSRLAGGQIEGKLHASNRINQTDTVVFEAQLKGSAKDKLGAALGLSSALAGGQWNGQMLTINRLKLRLADAELDGQLSWDRSTQATRANLKLNAPGLSAQALGQIAATEGQGQLTLDLSDAGKTGAWLAKLPGLDPATWAGLSRGTAQLKADWSGGWHNAGQALRLNARLKAQDGLWSAPGRSASAPRRAALALRSAQLAARWDGRSLLLDELNVLASGAELSGTLAWEPAGQATRADLRLTAPGLTAQAKGQISASAGQGRLQAELSDAGQAGAWLALWPGLDGDRWAGLRSGRAQFSSDWSGGWQNQGRGLRLNAVLKAQDGLWQPPPGSGQPAWRLSESEIKLSGSGASHRLVASAQLRQGEAALQASFAVQGGLRADPGTAAAWSGELQNANASWRAQADAVRWMAQLPQALRLAWQGGAERQRWSLGGASLRIFPDSPQAQAVRLQWQDSTLEQAAGALRLRSQGELRDLPLNWLQHLGLDLPDLPPEKNSVQLQGSWALDTGPGGQLRAELRRSAGDLELQLGGTTVKAGVRALSLRLQSVGEQLSASAVWDSEQGGQATAELTTRLDQRGGFWSWPATAPLSGQLQARLPQLGIWSSLVPPGWRARGTLQTEVAISGSRAAPQWRGTLQADQLALVSLVDGIEFQQGQLRASFDGDHLDVQRFQVQGAGQNGGSLTASGRVSWSGADPAARLQMALSATANDLRLSSRVDRRLAVSGELRANLVNQRLRLSGQLAATHAAFVLPDDSTPSLGKDVVLLRPAPVGAPPKPASTPAPQARLAFVQNPEVDVKLDLGPDFLLSGQGITTRLEGQLQLLSKAGTPPSVGAGIAEQLRLVGEVRTVGGTYRAWNQRLDIERGLLRFNGAYNNPTLDILALRPNLEQRVGVEVKGTALLPRITLYAQSDMSDNEKLAWLLLGRSGAAGGAEAALLQQAALALLGTRGPSLNDRLASTLGLDAITLGRSSSAGSEGSSANDAAIQLGKRFSRNFYVAYEHSLGGTASSLFLFYELSRRVTVRGQTGEKSALDLIFTLRYD